MWKNSPIRFDYFDLDFDDSFIEKYKRGKRTSFRGAIACDKTNYYAAFFYFQPINAWENNQYGYSDFPD